jgi:glutamate synthase domain-containing protein 2
LVRNELRDRVVVRVDGGVRSGRDILISAALGADEYGFGTVAMIATGCIMARVCHTNNCPVGVASQVSVKVMCLMYSLMMKSAGAAMSMYLPCECCHHQRVSTMRMLT